MKKNIKCKFFKALQAKSYIKWCLKCNLDFLEGSKFMFGGTIPELIIETKKKVEVQIEFLKKVKDEIRVIKCLTLKKE